MEFVPVTELNYLIQFQIESPSCFIKHHFLRFQEEGKVEFVWISHRCWLYVQRTIILWSTDCQEVEHKLENDGFADESVLITELIWPDSIPSLESKLFYQALPSDNNPTQLNNKNSRGKWNFPLKLFIDDDFMCNVLSIISRNIDRQKVEANWWICRRIFVHHRNYMNWLNSKSRVLVTLLCIPSWQHHKNWREPSNICVWISHWWWLYVQRAIILWSTDCQEVKKKRANDEFADVSRKTWSPLYFYLKYISNEKTVFSSMHFIIVNT